MFCKKMGQEAVRDVIIQVNPRFNSYARPFIVTAQCKSLYEGFEVKRAVNRV